MALHNRDPILSCAVESRVDVLLFLFPLICETVLPRQKDYKAEQVE